LNTLLIFLLFVKLLPRNFEKFKLLLILDNNFQESLQEPNIDVLPYVNTRYHWKAEQLALHIHPIVP
jgi:hypothetical protein